MPVPRTYRERAWARRAVALGDTLPAGALPCPPAFSAELCAKRATLVAKLAGVSILGAHPIDPAAASGIADAILDGVKDSATAGAKKIVVLGLAASTALTLVGVGFAVKAARHARRQAAR